LSNPALHNRADALYIKLIEIKSLKKNRKDRKETEFV